MSDQRLSLKANPTKTQRDRGATAVEYGLLMAFIAAIIVASVATLGVKVLGLFSSALPGF